MSYMIKVVCCVCKKDLGEKPGGKKPGCISHGYCEDCLAVEMKEIDRVLKQMGRR